VRQPPPEAEAANQVWSVDFMTDGLSSGRRFRTLNIVDDYTRECLAIEVDTSLGGMYNLDGHSWKSLGNI
jgi:putative transposase